MRSASTTCEATICDEPQIVVVKEENEENAHTNAVPSCVEIRFFHEIAFVFCMCCGQLHAQAAVAQAMAATQEIAKSFGVENLPGEQAWFSASFSLTVGTFILVSGKLGDMFGYKLMYITGLLFFALWSLICGFSAYAKSAVFFDVCRALQGAGLALLLPNAVAVLGHYYPPGSMRKTIVMCLFGAAAPSGFNIGALFSSFFAMKVWWPWTFWVCGIASVCLALLSYLCIPKKIGTPSRNEPFDWIGSILAISGLILFNFAWNQGSNVGWKIVYNYVLLIVSVGLVVAFAIVEVYLKHPLVPIKSLKGEPAFVLGCIATGWSCFGIWLYYTFQWAFYIDNVNAVVASVQFIPCSVTGFMASFTTAYLLRRTRLSFVMIMAMCAFFAGIIIIGTRHVGQTYWGQKFVSCLIQPFGMDMSFPAAIIILSNHFPPSKQGIAASLVATVQNYSVSLGLGFAGTVEKYKTDHLPQTFELKLLGIRVAFYMGMGLAGLGVVFSVIGGILQWKRTKKDQE